MTEQPIHSVVVTLGTIQGYGFRRLLERLVTIIPADCDVLWQTGESDVDGLPITAHPYLPQHELHSAMAQADAVIAHAGIGSALGALNAGRRPILVPRRSAYAEHVDDHQLQIARELHGRDLALYREALDLSWEDVRSAARWRVAPPPST
ncbi:glycosyltransferase [Blastococcus aurantiacus]